MAAKQAVIAAVIVAVAHLGTTAVAVAVAIATWAIWPVTTLKVARVIDLPLPRYLRRFLPPLFGCVVMTAAVLAFRQGVDLPRVPGLAAEIAIGRAAYTLAVLAVTGSELRAVAALARNRKG